MRAELLADASDPPTTSALLPVRTQGRHSGRLLLGGDQCYDAMIKSIDEARVAVRLESYIIRKGDAATSIFRALYRAARRGLQVRVLYDAFGSEHLTNTLYLALRDAGADVRAFNPRTLLKLSFRNHRKLLVCDSRVAIVGSFNIGPEYEGDGFTCGWYDLGLELRGPTVSALAESFDRMFKLAPFAVDAIQAFRADSNAASALSSRVRLLESGPGCKRGDLRRMMLRDLRRAKSVSIMSAYFLPSSKIRREFSRCIDRGGRVRLLLAGRTDVPIAKKAGEHLYATLLRRGVALYEYQPQVLHAKLIIMDDTVYIGSCNLDRRSLHINYELMVRLRWPGIADDARKLFNDALQHSERVVHEQHQRSRSLWSRLQSGFSYWLLARIDPLIANQKLRLLG